MASSGTVALSVDFRYKPPRGREESLIAGHGKVKSTAVIEANDLELRTIKAFTATPYDLIHVKGGAAVLYGSVNTAGSLMNAVTLRTLKGSQKVVTGTTHMGTIAAGSMQFGYMAIGA